MFSSNLIFVTRYYAERQMDMLIAIQILMLIKIKNTLRFPTLPSVANILTNELYPYPSVMNQKKGKRIKILLSLSKYLKDFLVNRLQMLQ